MTILPSLNKFTKVHFLHYIIVIWFSSEKGLLSLRTEEFVEVGGSVTNKSFVRFFLFSCY